MENEDLALVSFGHKRGSLHLLGSKIGVWNRGHTTGSVFYRWWHGRAGPGVGLVCRRMEGYVEEQRFGRRGEWEAGAVGMVRQLRGVYGVLSTERVVKIAAGVGRAILAFQRWDRCKSMRMPLRLFSYTCKRTFSGRVWQEGAGARGGGSWRGQEVRQWRKRNSGRSERRGGGENGNQGVSKRGKAESMVASRSYK